MRSGGDLCGTWVAAEKHGVSDYRGKDQMGRFAPVGWKQQKTRGFFKLGAILYVFTLGLRKKLCGDLKA